MEGGGVEVGGEVVCSGDAGWVADLVGIVAADAGEGAVGSADDGDGCPGGGSDDGVDLPAVDGCAEDPAGLEVRDVVKGGEVVAEADVVVGGASGAVEVEGVRWACVAFDGAGVVVDDLAVGEVGEDVQTMRDAAGDVELEAVVVGVLVGAGYLDGAEALVEASGLNVGQGGSGAVDAGVELA